MARRRRLAVDKVRPKGKSKAKAKGSKFKVTSSMLERGLSVVTPKTKCMWAKLLKPHAYQNKGVKKYTIDLIIPDKSDEGYQWWKDLKQKLRSILKAYIHAYDMPNRKKSKAQIRDLFLVRYDDDEEPLFSYIQAKTVSEYEKNGETHKIKPTIIDSHKNPMRVEIFNGSVVRVGLVCKPYYMASSNSFGISFYLGVVQVIKLVSSIADLSGFDVEEDGYVYSAKAEEPDTDDAYDEEEEYEDEDEYAEDDDEEYGDEEYDDEDDDEEYDDEDFDVSDIPF